MIEDTRSLTLAVHCGYEVLPAGTATRMPVLLRIQAAAAPEGAQRPPLCTVLCLDTSGSMKGEPLREVQHAVDRLGQILGDEDALGVVAFHSEAWALAPIRPLGQPGARAALRREVATLSAEGKTNIDSALAKAALLLPPPPPPSPGVAAPRQAILLLSDGQPNVGACRPDDLGAATTLIHQRGVNVSTLGFGKEHNEDVLVAIAQGGGGRYAYVKDPQAADTAFARALGAFLDLSARDVHLTLRPAPGVSIQRVLGNPRHSFGEGGLQVSLPDLLYGESLDVVVELTINARREPGALPLLRVTLEAMDGSGAAPGPGGARVTQVTREVEVFLGDVANNPQLAHLVLRPEVDRAEAQALMAMGRDEARARADRRDYEGAVALLRQALARIDQVPDFKQGEATPLGDAYEAIRDDIMIFEKRAPDRDEKYREYRKIQFDGQSVGGSLRGGGPTTNVSPSVRRMTNLVAAVAGVGGRLVVMQGAAQAGVSVSGAPNLPGVAPGQVLREFPVGGEVRIGRGRTNDLVLDEDMASRVHAVILPGGREGGFLLEDMGSSNGTQVNGSHIYRGTRLNDGDLIQIGRTILRFEALKPMALVK